MSVIYIREQGTYVRKQGERVTIEKAGQVAADIPIATVTSLSVFGNVQITAQALHNLLERGIDIAYFTYSGKYLGLTTADSTKNVFLRFAQHECYQDLERRLGIAKTIVRNKIQNQMDVIRKYRFEEFDPSLDLKKMEEILSSLQSKTTSNEIMGIEGSCSAVYFSVYAHMFRCETRFDKRSRRPPRDPVNVILSLGYTMLTKEVLSALESESFETYLGFLHGIRYGRKSLALDLVEEFRQPVIDRLVLLLFNKRMINEMDFEREGDEIILNDSGFRKFFTSYEKWMRDPVGKTNAKSFRSIIRIQANELKHAIRENREYKPYRWYINNVCDQL